jgi:putative NADH-flavin reductase
MIVAVLGASGRTGRPLTEELLRRGHHVVGLVRDPARAPDGIETVVGSSTDPVALADLVDGCEAVVSALGPSDRENDLHTRTAGLLVEALPARARFIGVSGAGIDVPGDRKGGRDKAISFMVRTLGGAMAADKAHEYRIYAESDLDWTLARPPRLKDGPATRRVAHDAHVPGRSSSIRRADLAVFLVDVLEGQWYVREAPFVCSG